MRTLCWQVPPLATGQAASTAASTAMPADVETSLRAKDREINALKAQLTQVHHCPIECPCDPKAQLKQTLS